MVMSKINKVLDKLFGEIGRVDGCIILCKICAPLSIATMCFNSIEGDKTAFYLLLALNIFYIVESSVSTIITKKMINKCKNCKDKV